MGNAFAWIRARLKGLKTIVSAGGVIIVGALNVAGTVDLHPLVAYFVSDEKQLGAVMVALGIMFGAYRFATTSPIFQAAPDPVAVPPLKNVDAGA